MKKNFKIVVTDENDNLVFKSDFRDFVKEVVSSDNSCGYDTRAYEIEISDFAEIIKENIIESWLG